jgi:hypothetical protein
LKINGVASRLLVEGIITLKWPIKDDNDNEIDLNIHNALYIPSAPMGLLCHQQIVQQMQHPQDGFNALAQHGMLTFAGFKGTVPYNRENRLPIMHSIDGIENYMKAKSEIALTSKIDDPANTDDNLSHIQRLLMKWHNRLPDESTTGKPMLW